MRYQLKNKNYNDENVELALYNLLKDRGIEEPVKWLYPTEEYEYSPFEISNIKKAIQILNRIIKNPDASILVVVDSDMDGYTSGAIIMNLLKLIQKGQDIEYVLHPGKEHGIDLKDIPDGIDLIIVPDAGTGQKEEHLKLLENGTEIIILDHHEFINDFDYGEYQSNIAIVNSQIDYKNPALSGAGVALKFAQAYCSTYGIRFPMKLYALAACGIVADVMDISNLENKMIIDTGLKYIKEHLFLYGIIKKAHFNVEDPKPSIKDIGWNIGPSINSIIRLGTMEQKHIIFKALCFPNNLILTSKRGEEGLEIPLYEEAIRLCDNAKKRQTTAINKSISIIENNLEDDGHNSIIYIDENQDLTFELSGLIANKILSQTNKPVILLRRFIDGKGVDEYRGSVRGKPVDGITNLKDLVKNITGVEMAEGHGFAFGIGIDKDMLPEFKAHLNSILDNIDFNVNLYMVDLESRYNLLNKDIAIIMAKDNIWAHGVEKPLAVLKDIPSDNFELMGNEQQHIKINCGSYDVIIFNNKTLADELSNGQKYDIDAVGEFDIDKSYNIGRLQFIVKDYDLKKHTEQSIWDYVF